MSKRELAIALLLVMGLLAPLIEIPIANAIIPQDQTISIDSTHNDKWTTGTGAIGIDSWLVHVLDPGYDVYSWVIFREVEINFWEPLHNATLRLYTGNTLEFDKDSSITIYGMKVDELQNILPIGPSYAVSVPKTDHYVNLNTSQFYGPSKWWDIDVTAIVEELIRSPNWDGDGITGGETGDAIGFIMYGESGYDVRYFVDYRSDPALSAQLVIHWNHQPPLTDPPNDYEFIEQYRNYTIWQEILGAAWPLEPIEYVFSEGTSSLFDVMYDTVDAPDTPVSITGTESGSETLDSNQRQITRDSNGTLHAVYAKKLATKMQVYSKESFNNGTTWVNATRISTSVGMDVYDQLEPSIAVDGSDNLHCAFSGTTAATQEQIFYSKYTDSWSTPIQISYKNLTGGNVRIRPAIAVDSQNDIHIAWAGQVAGVGESQIYYAKYVTSWSDQLRLSNYTAMEACLTPTIEIDSIDNLHVCFPASVDGLFALRQMWYVKYTDSWTYPLRLSTANGIDEEASGHPSMAITSEDNLHLVFECTNPRVGGHQSIWYVNYTTDWSYPIIISNGTAMDNYDERYPNIAADSNNYLHVLWSGKDTGLTDYDKIWYINHTTSWNIPAICLQTVGYNHHPILRWSRWPYPGVGTFLVADLNGTIIENDFDTLQDAKDWIDIDPDPLDPDPPGWVTEGPFTRFKMRLYLLVVGYFAVWGPIWFMCWRRPSGYYICGGALIMLMGLGLLLQIVYV